jgi:hypothetical protein
MASLEEFAGTARYRVIRRLGAGGMGVVYEAEDGERGQRVALKTLRYPDADTLYRMKQEFRALADLSHRNLVALHELVVGERCFFTMELVRGTDLLTHVCGPRGPALEPRTVAATRGASDRVAPAATGTPPPRAHRFDEARLRAALPQLTLGLMALHDAGKIHRDVKPSNILVADDGRVVLVDFGVASVWTHPHHRDHDSFAGHAVGTAAYMAPEQGRGDPRLSPAADFYAVGVILYQALTGVLPFQGDPLQVLWQKQTAAASPPHARVAALPADLDALCVELLARDPAARPTGRQILERLGAAPAHTPRPVAAAFTGRDDELGVLRAGLDAAVEDGAAAVVLLRGASGIGKSALCHRFLARARAAHPELVVLEGRCYERETVPYQAMDSLVDHLSHYWLGLSDKDAAALLPREAALLARLFPVLGRVPCIAEAPRAHAAADPHEQRTRAFAALREVLARLSERRPLVLFLDDLQWVDASTLALLADLMRPPDPPRALLVLATRLEGGAVLAEVVRRMDANAQTLDLGPLAGGAAAALAGELLGPEAGARASAVAAESGGNPFFLGELVRYLQTVEHAELGALRLDDVLAGRLAQLSAPGRRLLELVALAGEPIAARTLDSAFGAGASGADLDVDVDSETRALTRLRFLRSAGEERLEPYHDRVRDAVRGALGDETRRAHHRALALAYERWSALSDERLALHWQGAGEVERAAEHARRAADAALARLDFDRAAHLYGMTLELSAPGAAETSDLHARRGEALAHAGRPLEAARALVAATAGADSTRDIELQRRAAEELLRGGYVEEGLAAVRRVLAYFRLPLAEQPWRALLAVLLRRAWLRLRGMGWRARDAGDVAPRALAWQDVLQTVSLGLGFVDTIRGLDFQTRALTHALRLGEPDRLARALSFESAYLASGGNRVRARRTLLLADRAVAQSRSPYAPAIAALAHGLVLFLGDNDWRAATARLQEAEALFAAQGRAGWEIDIAHHYQTFALLHVGEMGELARRVPALVLEAERRGDLFAAIGLRARLNLVWLLRDAAASARDDLEAAMASWRAPAHSFQVQHLWSLLSRGDTALYNGAIDDPGLDDAPGLAGSLLLRVAILRVELTDLRGRLALARAVASSGAATRRAHLDVSRRLARRLARERLPMARPLATLLEAGVLELEGRADKARTRLGQAMQLLDDGGLGLYATAARRRLGQLIGGAEGQGLRAEADAWFAARGVREPARMTAMLAPAME